MGYLVRGVVYLFTSGFVCEAVLYVVTHEGRIFDSVSNNCSDLLHNSVNFAVLNSVPAYSKFVQKFTVIDSTVLRTLRI